MSSLFIDPVAQVYVRDPSGQNEWRWQAPNDPFLVGVALNFEMGRVSKLTYMVDMPYEDGIRMLTKPTPFQVGNLVRARIGYASGHWTPWSEGILLAGGEGIALDPNGLSGQVTVEGVATSAYYKVSREDLAKAGHNPRKIIEVCAAAMGLAVSISNRASAILQSYQVIPGNRGKAARKRIFSFSSHLLNLSNWDAIKQITNEWNLTFWMGPDPKDESKGGVLFIDTFSGAALGKTFNKEQTQRTYIMRGVLDVSRDQYPCVSWTPEGARFAEWLAEAPDPAAHGVEVAFDDADTGETKTIVVSPKDQPVPTEGVLADNEPEDTEVDGVVGDRKTGDAGEYLATPAEPGKAGEEQVRREAEKRQIQGNAAQTGTIVSIGVPEESAGNLCDLRGCGDIYNGTYLIQKMTQSYSPGVFETSMVVLRHGRIEKAGKQEETSEGQMPEVGA
jgi:hypothetical protein